MVYINHYISYKKLFHGKHMADDWDWDFECQTKVIVLAKMLKKIHVIKGDKRYNQTIKAERQLHSIMHVFPLNFHLNCHIRNFEIKVDLSIVF